MYKTTLTAAVCAALTFAGAALAVDPEPKCQGGKNKAAGKYAFCRYKAEKGLAFKGDLPKYNAAIAKCASKFSTVWQKEIARAAASGAVCLDAPLVEGDFKAAIDAHTDIVAVALSGGGLVDCASELATCSGDLGICNSDLGICSGDLGTCNSDLGTCSTNYANCSSSLATCSAGTASGADVLVGKTFSSSAGIGATGTMPNNGAMSITPSTVTQTIPAGYHNGSGSVDGDADLTAGNIKLGVTLFGVSGTLGCGDGAIDAGEQCDQNNLNGATCVTQGFAFGSLQCGANCSFDTSGCFTTRFTDNGDGTVSDAQTGLMWEKKGHFDGVAVECTSAVVCPDAHDADNQYTYSFDNPLGPPGTAFTVMLTQLNAGGGFAGHTDWRLPTLEELQGVTDYADATAPVTNAVFDTGCTSLCDGVACSCTVDDVYWTNDLVSSIPGNAWTVDFGDGSALNDTRDTTYFARAVR